MNILIVGCGRLGVELALALHQNHIVSVIDRNPRAFDRLGLHFSGRTVQGHGMDRTALERAGIPSDVRNAESGASMDVLVPLAQADDARRLLFPERRSGEIYYVPARRMK